MTKIDRTGMSCDEQDLTIRMEIDQQGSIFTSQVCHTCKKVDECIEDFILEFQENNSGEYNLEQIPNSDIKQKADVIQFPFRNNVKQVNQDDELHNEEDNFLTETETEIITGGLYLASVIMTNEVKDFIENTNIIPDKEYLNKLFLPLADEMENIIAGLAIGQSNTNYAMATISQKLDPYKMKLQNLLLDSVLK